MEDSVATHLFKVCGSYCHRAYYGFHLASCKI